MEIALCNTSGRIKNLGPYVPYMGSLNYLFCCLYSQMSTMFVEQGMVMDTTFGSFTIPVASISTFDTISVIVWIPIYDSNLMPAVRMFTGKEKGLSELQRMGIGLFISILAMISAAGVEIRHLQLAKELGLVDENIVVPLKIFWRIPQFFLVGAAEVFPFIRQLEFFHYQSPDAMRSLCSALSLLTTALGSYLNSLILTIVAAVTSAGGKPRWILDNLNKGRLDNFFWLMARLSFSNLVVYAFCAMRYKQKEAS